MVRYIAATTVTHRGPRLSQPIIRVTPSAYDAKAAPAPDVWSDCRASVLSISAGAIVYRWTRASTPLATALAMRK